MLCDRCFDSCVNYFPEKNHLYTKTFIDVVKNSIVHVYQLILQNCVLKIWLVIILIVFVIFSFLASNVNVLMNIGKINKKRLFRHIGQSNSFLLKVEN